MIAKPLVAGLSLLCLVGCINRGPMPPKPCGDPAICLKFRMDGDWCCEGDGGVYFKWTVYNDNPDKAIQAVIVAERQTAGGGWVVEDAVFYEEILPKKAIQLDCSRLDEGGCEYGRRYSAWNPCFVDDPECVQPQLPADPPQPPAATCAEFDYSLFPWEQQVALRELFAAVHQRRPPAQLNQGVFEGIFGAGGDLCSNRTTSLDGDAGRTLLTSMGDSCTVGSELPRAMPIGATGKSTRVFWVSLSSVVEGEVTRAGNLKSMVTFRDAPHAIRIEMAIDGEPDEYQTDFLRGIVAEAQPPGSNRGSLTAFGEHICVTIADIPIE